MATFFHFTQCPGTSEERCCAAAQLVPAPPAPSCQPLWDAEVCRARDMAGPQSFQGKASLPVQAASQTRLPITSSAGEGFCTARRTYSFKIEAGAANVRAAPATTARCGQQEGYRVWHMPLSVTGTALHVGPRKGFHQHVLTHFCLAAAAGLESTVCATRRHGCLRGGGDGPGCKAATTAQPVCSRSASPARCSRNSFHSSQVKMVLVCTCLVQNAPSPHVLRKSWLPDCKLLRCLHRHFLARWSRKCCWRRQGAAHRYWCHPLWTNAAPLELLLLAHVNTEPGGEAGRGVAPRMQLLETALLPCLSSGVSPPPYSVTVRNPCTEAGKRDFVSLSLSVLVTPCPSGRDHHRRL